MLVSAADREEILRQVKLAEEQGRANHPLVKLLRRITHPAGLLQVTLPYPISANRYWRPVHIGQHVTIVPTKEAKEYKASVAWLMVAAGVRSPYAGRVAMHIALYPNRPQDYRTRMRKDPIYWADTVQRLDLDNSRKVLGDALNGVAFTDDKCIWMDGGEVMEPDGRDKCVVLTLWPLMLDSPQATIMLPDRPKAILPAPEPVPAPSASTPQAFALPF